MLFIMLILLLTAMLIDIAVYASDYLIVGHILPI